MSFVRAANPVWYFVDLVGLGLNDEYFAFFLTNTLPYLPQAVYRDDEGTTAWPNPLQFFPNGTLPNNLYFDPNLVYRIEIRHGDSQADPLIYEINDFVPGNGNINPTPGNSILFSENQVSNGQFSDVLFTDTVASSPNPTITYSTAGTYEIAPGWFLVLTGTGTSIVTQHIYSGDQNTSLNPNPPFTVSINNNNWTNAYLFQRFTKNGGIFANGAISMSLTGRGLGGSALVTMNYVPSVGMPLTVATGTLTTINFQKLAGTINVGDVANNELNDVAYVDMQILIPTSGQVELSDVQFVGQSIPIPDQPVGVDIPSVRPDYQQVTEERTIDHLFHYYKTQLIIKPKRSLLTGWNFSLNPFQFQTATITTIVNETQYICDQTVLHQEAASQLQTGEATVVGERLGLQVQPVVAAATTRFALIQYIDPSTIRPYWSYVLSALARARIFTTHGTNVRLKCRLIYRADTTFTNSAVVPIASWAVGADPVFSVGWTEIRPLNDPAYILPNAYENGTVSTSPFSYPSFAFEQFQLPDATSTTQLLGIVLYTMDNMDSTAVTFDSIIFDKVSLIPSLFASDAYPQTYDESLKECEFYYEKSYNDGILPGTAVVNGELAQQNGITNAANAAFQARSWNVLFKRTKRIVPTVVFYSPTTGAINNVHGYVRNNGGFPVAPFDANLAFAAAWQVFPGISYNNAPIIPTSAAALITSGSIANNPDAFLTYHYTADARIGV